MVICVSYIHNISIDGYTLWRIKSGLCKTTIYITSICTSNTVLKIKVHKMMQKKNQMKKEIRQWDLRNLKHHKVKSFVWCLNDLTATCIVFDEFELLGHQNIIIMFIEIVRTKIKKKDTYLWMGNVKYLYHTSKIILPNKYLQCTWKVHVLFYIDKHCS